MSEYQPLEARKVPKIGRKWAFENVLFFREPRKVRNVKRGSKIHVHAKSEKSQAINGRDLCPGRPISSLLKIRSRELFLSGLP